MSTSDRTIRVFISSTFRDMQQERDALTKVVFPSLREKFKNLNIELLDIDLRWGISTDKEDEETIAKCFQYIDECDPYFIGVLGKRYGGIPKSIPNEILEKNPWLAPHKKKSFTELEILYSIFNPNRKGSNLHTHFFYFRRSSKKEDKPIYKLKQQLRKKAEQNEISLLDGYQNIDEFRKRVYEDLERMIEAKFSKAGAADAVQGLKERQQAYIETQTRFYFPSQNQTDFEKYVNGNERGIFITGESGLGKSSFLANWIVSNRQKFGSQWKIIHHFVGADFENASAPKIYQQLVREIGNLYNVDYERQSVKIADAQRDFFEMLESVPDTEKLIIVIDGINQLEIEAGAKSFLFNLSNLPKNVKMIVSATLEYEPLAIQNSWIIFRLGLLEKEAKEKLIIEYFKNYKKDDIKPEYIDKISSEDITSHPLYLTKLIEEIRIHNDMFTLGKKIDEYLQSKTAVELLEKIINRLEDDYSLKNNKGLVANTLCFLYMTKYGISVLDLRMAVDRDLPSIDWVPFFNNIQTYLIYSSGRYSLFHDRFREAVKNLYLHDNQNIMNYRRLIVNYYYEEATRAKKWEHIKALEVIYQLIHLKDGEFLYKCLSDVEFIKAAINDNDDAVSEAWDFVEEHTNHGLIDSYKHILQNTKSYDEVICWKLAQLFISKGYYKETLILQPYIKTDLTTDRIKLTIDEFHNLIKKSIKRKKYEQAEGALHTLSNLNKKILSLKGISYCNKYLGITYEDLAEENPSKHQEYLEMSLKAYQDEQRVLELLDNDKELIRCYSFQGNVLMELGQFEEALRLKKAEEKILLSKKDGNIQLKLAYCLNNQAILYMKLKQPEEAEKYISRALRLLPGINRVNIVYLSRVHKLWKKEDYRKHAHHFKLMEENLLREEKDYKELANCLNELARYVSYFQYRPYTAFSYTVEVLIYLLMYNDKKGLKHNKDFVNKLTNFYGIPIFSEIMEELLQIPREKWFDEEFRETYILNIRNQIREISDEVIDEDQEEHHVDISFEYVESRLEYIKECREHSLKLDAVNELESMANKIDNVELKAFIYEKITPYLSQSKSIKLFPVLKRWKESLTQLKQEEKLPECLFLLANAYMNKNKKYPAMRTFFNQQQISKKLKNHHFYFYGRVSLANLLRSVGRKEAAISIFLDLRKYMDKYVAESERSSFYLNYDLHIRGYVDDYYKLESVQKVTTREGFLDYFTSQPAYKQIANYSIKAYILESVERYSDAADHFIKIGEQYRSIGMTELIIPNLNKQIQLYSRAKEHQFVIKKYKEVIDQWEMVNDLENKVICVEKAITYAKEHSPEDVEYFAFILNKVRPYKQETDSVIKTIVSETVRDMDSGLLTKKEKQAYRPDNMISLVDIYVKEEDFLQSPCPYLIEEFVDYFKENLLFKEPLIVSKDNELLYGLETYLAAKELNSTQVPVIYHTHDQITSALIEKGKKYSFDKEYAKALHVLKFQQKLAMNSKNFDDFLHGAVILSTTYSFSGNIEKAVSVFYDLYKYLEEINEAELFEKVLKKCKDISSRFHKKYQLQLDSSISPEESYKVSEEGSLYRMIGEHLEEATTLANFGQIENALRKYEEIIQIYKEYELDNLVDEGMKVQNYLLKRMNEYELVFDKYAEILKWIREKGYTTKYEEYLIQSESYFIAVEQYRKGLVFYALKHKFYTLGENLDAIAAFEEKLIDKARHDIFSDQEESKVVAVKIENIKILTSFRNKPIPTKIEEKEKYYVKHNEFSKPILCTSDFFLVDGFATYFAAKKLNLSEITVRLIGMPLSDQLGELVVKRG